MPSRHLIDITDLSVQEWEDITRLACDIGSHLDDYYGVCRGKILATLFYEPSTRTQMSFQTAMLRLGGRIIGFDNPANSSVSKGESLKDTVRVVSGYADIIAMRHPKEGAPLVASMNASVPVINAGDGGHNHPTQTLTDLLTIRREKGRLSDFTVGFCGDLKFGRTVHSLIAALTRYPGVRFVLVSPDELRLPEYVRRDILEARGVPYTETADLSAVLGELDILYMTRVQKERFFNEADYIRLKDTYILDPDKLKTAKKDMAILHPLPRVNEISTKVDADPRAMYFEQVRNGRFVRMALISTLLEGLYED